MLVTAPGQIQHGKIGPDATADSPVGVVTRAPEVALSRGVGRRRFLEALGMLGAVSAGIATVSAPNTANAKVFTEEEMDDFDKNRTYLIQKDGEKEMSLGEFNKENKPTEAKIKEYIGIIVERAVRFKSGVHMQRHENIMWLIKYFNDINKANPSIKTDPRVFYYPAKVGINSKFVADFLAKSRINKTEIVIKNNIEEPYKDDKTRN